MEEKAEKPTEKEAKNGEKKWHCPICGARIWLSNKKEAYPIQETQRRQLCAEREVRNKLAYSN